MSDRGKPHRRRPAAAAAALTVALLWAAPGAAATTVREVTIDCAGDVVTGHAQVQDPTAPTATVVLYGWRSGSRTVVARTGVHLQRNVTEISYQFTLDHHDEGYQVAVSVGPDAGLSDRIGDSTCAPPVEVPEAGAAVAVPAAMGLAGLGWWLRRRRTVR